MLAATLFVHEPGYPVVWWERQCQAAFCTAAIKIQILYPLKKKETAFKYLEELECAWHAQKACS